MLRALKKTHFSCILWCWLLLNALIAHAKSWQPIVPGIEYLDLRYKSLSQWSHVHAFRVNLQAMQFSIVMAKELPQHYASAQAYRKFSHALIALNGGFFNPNKSPLGLRISEHRVLNPLKPISWWGVFFIKNQHAAITTPYEFRTQKNIDFAIQSGPRLVVDGKIPALRAGYANRSVLGIDPRGRVIVVVTENLPITTTDLAQILKAPPLNCVDALNLDGGSSSQVYAKIDNFKLDLPGFTQVSDAIVIKRR